MFSIFLTQTSLLNVAILVLEIPSFDLNKFASTVKAPLAFYIPILWFRSPIFFYIAMWVCVQLFLFKYDFTKGYHLLDLFSLSLPFPYEFLDPIIWFCAWDKTMIPSPKSRPSSFFVTAHWISCLVVVIVFRWWFLWKKITSVTISFWSTLYLLLESVYPRI